MKRFAEFFEALDRTNSTNDKAEIIKEYFSKANDKDKLWTLYLFCGEKIRKTVNARQLKEWAIEYSSLPEWLFYESYNSVGDLGETISLILPVQKNSSDKTLTQWIKYIEEINNLNEENKKVKILDAWESLSQNEIFVFNKLISAGFRAGISKKTIINALSELENIETNIISHRLMSNWHPDKTTYNELIKVKNIKDEISKPYPFYFGYPLECEPEELGNNKDWQAEWVWSGIRVQMIYRKGELFIWTGDEELVTGKFPEFELMKNILPDGIVLDGEIVSHSNGKPLPFNFLQTRIGRKKVTQKILKEVPVVFMIYDVLEFNGKDIRSETLKERREKIFDFRSLILDFGCLKVSEEIKFSDWKELGKIRVKSRELLTEGIILKRKNSIYLTGRKKGDWWKWKVEPLTIDAVMIYVQKGQGRTADLFTDFTFAVWDKGKLVSLVKANSGLTDLEIKEVDEFVRKNTLEKFGPVRTIKPELVFEIAFEGISESSRHKSGVTLRFPRIARWKKDKKIEEADSLDSIKKLIKNE